MEKLLWLRLMLSRKHRNQKLIYYDSSNLLLFLKVRRITSKDGAMPEHAMAYFVCYVKKKKKTCLDKGKLYVTHLSFTFTCICNHQNFLPAMLKSLLPIPFESNHQASYHYIDSFKDFLEEHSEYLSQ